jgi:hypothetical protein
LRSPTPIYPTFYHSRDWDTSTKFAWLLRGPLFLDTVGHWTRAKPTTIPRRDQIREPAVAGDSIKPG